MNLNSNRKHERTRGKKCTKRKVIQRVVKKTRMRVILAMNECVRACVVRSCVCVFVCDGSFSSLGGFLDGVKVCIVCVRVSGIGNKISQPNLNMCVVCVYVLCVCVCVSEVIYMYEMFIHN